MLINYKKVTLQHDNDDPILEHIDFQVKEGEFVYIIGKVGTGKSSLLKSMYCEMSIKDAEESTVLGKDVRRIKRSHIPGLRRQMGIVFQDFQLLHDHTVNKNLSFVLKATGWKDEYRQERVDEVAEAVGISDKLMRMPHELSGGEQQRAAIARAILNKPKLIIADEPTGNLDPETATEITSLLHKISKEGAAVIMTTHNLNLINSFPGTVYLVKDRNIEDVTKTYKEIIANMDI